MATDRLFSLTNRVTAALKAIKFHLFTLLQLHATDDRFTDESHIKHV